MGMSSQKLLSMIRKAFSDVKLEDGISISQARLADDWCEDPKEYEKARKHDSDKTWQEIKAEKLASLHDTLSFMDSKSYRFYLPAFLKLALEDSDFDYIAIDNLSMIWCLADNHYMNKICLFDMDQVNCIIKFLEYSLDRCDEYDRPQIEIALTEFCYKFYQSKWEDKNVKIDPVAIKLSIMKTLPPERWLFSLGDVLSLKQAGYKDEAAKIYSKIENVEINTAKEKIEKLTNEIIWKKFWF